MDYAFNLKFHSKSVNINMSPGSEYLPPPPPANVYHFKNHSDVGL
jgi:hypothetical protein